MKQFEVLIELKDVYPKCLRKLIVDGGVNFEDFHTIIQICMGWNNSHLYEFQFYDGTSIAGYKDEFGKQEDKLASMCLIEDYIYKENELTYVYDFGDNWEHSISIKEIESDTVEVAKILFTQGACPPDDIGGSHGYYEHLNLYRKGMSEELMERMDWLDMIGYKSEDTYDKEIIQEKLDNTTKAIKLGKPTLH